MKKIIGLSLLTLSLVFASQAQVGTVDPTFNPLDAGNGAGFGITGDVTASCMQPDGKLLVAGYFSTYNNQPSQFIARTNADGTFDSTFVSGFVDTGNNEYIYTIAVQPDGKILVGGSFNAVNGTPVGKIARLNDDGSLDASFTGSVAGGFNAMIRGMMVQPDGKIFVTGVFNTVNGVSQSGVARFNADGTLDTGFNPGTSFDSFAVARTCLLQPDGKIIVAGTFAMYDGSPAPGIVRINTDGTIDSTFDTGTGIYGLPLTLARQNDGKILIGGQFSQYDGNPAINIVRIQTDGSWDSLFTANTGTAPIQDVNAIVPNTAGDLLIAGAFDTLNGVVVHKIARLDSTGMLLGSFDSGSGFDGPVKGLLPVNDSVVCAYGEFSTYNGVYANRICRLNGDGTRDNSFNPTSGLGGPGCKSKIGPDNKIYVYGQLMYYNAERIFGLVRLEQDGLPDTTFQANLDYTSEINTIDFDSEGRVLVGGNLNFQGSATNYRLARLNSDGTPDMSFSTDLAPTTYVFAITVLEDDRVVIGGQLFLTGDSLQKGVLRLEENGSNDPSFAFNLFETQMAYAIVVQEDGKLIVSGFFQSPAVPFESLVRLEPNGGFDASFDTTAQLGYGQLRLLDGGKLLLLESELVLRRINANGTIDTAFNFVNPTGGSIYTFDVQSNGSILYGGNLVTSPDPTNNVRRCLPNGAHDADFDVVNGSGTMNYVSGITLQEDGNFILTGYFSSYNGTGKNRIARIFNCVASLETNVEFFVLPSDANDCTGNALIQDSDGNDLQYAVDNGPFVAGGTSVMLTGLCAGMHDLRMLNACGDTLTTTFVIPVDSNYIFNNPFIDSIAVDSLGTTVENCDIYYNGIDTAYIADIFANADTLTITWTIVDVNGVNTVVSTYILGSGNGVYDLQLSVFCPQKSLGQYFTVTQAIYFDGQNAHVAGLNEEYLIGANLYPNPTTDSVTITCTEPSAKVSVYDAQGKLIATQMILSGGQVSLAGTQSGVYFFELTTPNGRAVKRIVKQ